MRYCYFCRKDTETKKEDCTICGMSKVTPDHLVGDYNIENYSDNAVFCNDLMESRDGTLPSEEPSLNKLYRKNKVVIDKKVVELRELEELHETINELKEIVMFYANEDNWDEEYLHEYIIVMNDENVGGEKAREFAKKKGWI